MPIKSLIADAKQRMDATTETVRRELSAMRTGRASLSMLDNIRVDYYGTPTPLNQVGNLGIPDPTLITIQPWDPSTLPAIEKAIRASDLDLNPQNDGKIVRIPIPSLTEERRKELCKQARARGEEAKISVRNGRRDANEMLKEGEKDKEISQDDLKRSLEKVQEETDKGIKKIDEMIAKKEKEILEI